MFNDANNLSVNVIRRADYLCKNGNELLWNENGEMGLHLLTLACADRRFSVRPHSVPLT